MNLLRWFTTVLIASEILTACVNNSRITPTSSAPPLPVTTYLDTTDPQEAVRLFEELLNHPVPEILKALKAPRNYPVAPTGRLPEQTVTLNDKKTCTDCTFQKTTNPHVHIL